MLVWLALIPDYIWKFTDHICVRPSVAPMLTQARAKLIEEVSQY